MDACQHLKFQLLQIPFFLRICHTELHDHVSALAEQRVNMCCAFTHQLCSRRWAQWTGKVGLPLAINLKYPYKTSHLRCRIAVHVFSVAFNPGFPGIEQPKKIYWQGWRDVKEFQTEKKRYHNRHKPSSLPWESKSAHTTRCSLHIWELE